MLSGLTGWTGDAVTAATAMAAAPDCPRSCPLDAATSWWCCTWFWWCSISGWWYGVGGAPHGPVPVTYSVLGVPQATRGVGAARLLSHARWLATPAITFVYCRGWYTSAARIRLYATATAYRFVSCNTPIGCPTISQMQIYNKNKTKFVYLYYT